MYYTIHYQTEDKQVGKAPFPQVDSLTQAYTHSLNAWEFPSFEPKMIFKLVDKAILTDILSDTSINADGYLLSQKAKEILDSFTLMTHKFYPVNLITSNGDLTYYWLHLSEPNLINCLDFKKSVFYETMYELREDIIELDSFEKYLEKKKLDEGASFGVELDKIALTEKFNLELDLFTFLPFDNNIYISENLKTALLENNINGIDFKKANNFI